MKTLQISGNSNSVFEIKTNNFFLTVIFGKFNSIKWLMIILFSKFYLFPYQLINSIDAFSLCFVFWKWTSDFLKNLQVKEWKSIFTETTTTVKPIKEVSIIAHNKSDIKLSLSRTIRMTGNPIPMIIPVIKKKIEKTTLEVFFGQQKHHLKLSKNRISFLHFEHLYERYGGISERTTLL